MPVAIAMKIIVENYAVAKHQTNEFQFSHVNFLTVLKKSGAGGGSWGLKASPLYGAWHVNAAKAVII